MRCLICARDQRVGAGAILDRARRGIPAANHGNGDIARPPPNLSLTCHASDKAQIYPLHMCADPAMLISLEKALHQHCFYPATLLLCCDVHQHRHSSTTTTTTICASSPRAETHQTVRVNTQ